MESRPDVTRDGGMLSLVVRSPWPRGTRQGQGQTWRYRDDKGRGWRWPAAGDEAYDLPVIRVRIWDDA